MQVVNSKPRIKLSNSHDSANIHQIHQLKNHRVYEVQDMSLEDNQYCYMVIGEKDEVKNNRVFASNDHMETATDLALESDQLFVNGQHCCRFTEVERQTFYYLNRRRGKPVSRDELYHVLYQGERAPFCRRIDNLISAMRKKVEKNQLIPELIITVRHKGYMLK